MLCCSANGVEILIYRTCTSKGLGARAICAAALRSLVGLGEHFFSCHHDVYCQLKAHMLTLTEAWTPSGAVCGCHEVVGSAA